MSYRVDEMTAADWDCVRSIYLQGIATGHATFESDAPSWDDWDSRHLERPRLVARAGDTILGWGAVSPVTLRCVYAGVAEISLYVGEEHRGRGVGAALLRVLIEDSERVGVWTLQAGIFPKNRASLELMRRNGFRVVGTRERLGRMTYGPRAGTWRDIVLLERRSKVAGA